MPVEPLAAGDPAEVAGYRLRGRLGAGGMGVVYLTFTPGGRPVALKLVRPELGDDPDFRSRFRHEVDAAQRVHGLYTAPLLDADPDGTPPWLVTGYVAGPSLAAAVAAHGPMPTPTVLLLAAGIAEALAAIHSAGLVHRDLKPSNVLLAADGPRVIDFGIARALDGTALTATGMRIGSPQYMAPEQARGETVTPATDVFALGATIAYAALGRSPFGDGDAAAVLYRIQHLDPDLTGVLDGPLADLVRRCLAKDPASRPEHAQIIAACTGGAAVRTIQYTDTWLPPAFAADFSGHAAPRPISAAGTTAAPAAAPAMPGPQQRLSQRAVLATAVAAVVIAALGISAGALAASRGQGSSHQAGNVALRSPSPSARPSPSPSSTLDSCLFGTWTGVGTEQTGTISGQQVTFTGKAGVTQIFRPDGVNVWQEGPAATVSARVNGITWTQKWTGAATMNYLTRDGQIFYSNEKTKGTATLYKDGVYSNSNALTFNPVPETYTCSATTLTLNDSTGFSEKLTRSVPAAPSTSETPEGS